MDLNRVSLIGNVVRDPEMRTTPSGQNVASFAVATNRTWKDANGQKQTKAEFHNIVAWRRLGEIVGQYVKKGSRIYLEGRSETRSWDDQSGIKRYRTEVIAENMIMLDRANAGGGSMRSESPSAPMNQMNQGMSEPTAEPTEEMSIEDIPF